MNKAKHQFPRFITVEGGEGAGKTTLIKTLEEAFSAKGISVVITREPGGTPFGEAMREWLLTRQSTVSIGTKAELLLFLAARSQHIEEVINPAIAAGSCVICDRYNDSSVAYQGAGRGLGVDWVRALCDSICGNVSPEITLYLDVDPKIGLERRLKVTKDNAPAGEVDRIEAEKLEFHQRVRNAFLEMAKQEPKRFHRIDASMPLNAVANEALSIVMGSCTVDV